MDAVLAGISDAFTLVNLAFIALGVAAGTTVGAIPGLNGPMAIALCVPLTYYMSPLMAIAFLVGLNKGSTFGGSISAILLNTPGTPEAIATTFDGYPLAQKGKGLKALKMALYASISGDTFSDLVLILVAAPIAGVAIKMGPPELLAVTIFALTLIAALESTSLLKGLIAAFLGILVNCVGTDPLSASPRLTFGIMDLQAGIPLAAIAIGLLALSEVWAQLEEPKKTGPVFGAPGSQSAQRGKKYFTQGIPGRGADNPALQRDRHRHRDPARPWRDPSPPFWATARQSGPARIRRNSARARWRG